MGNVKRCFSWEGCERLIGKMLQLERIRKSVREGGDVGREIRLPVNIINLVTDAADLVCDGHTQRSRGFNKL